MVPLGLVCGENSSRQRETWMDRHIQMWQCSRARSVCSVECCWRLMGGGGHIVSAPTKQEGASRASVHMQGLCVLAWCAWCSLGGGQTQSSTRCRRDNNPPHESFVESDSRARMSYHNHPKSRLHSIT